MPIDTYREAFSPSELRRGATFTVFFWMLAVAAVLGHRAYAPLLLAPLFAIDWRHAYHARRSTFRALEPQWLIYFSAAGVFCFYTLLSGLWSPLPSKIDWAWRFLLCFAIAPFAFHSVRYLTPAARARAAAAGAWATLAMAGLLVFEALSNAMIRQTLPPEEELVRDIISLGRGALLLSLLVWPARKIFDEQLGRPIVGWALVVVAFVPALKLSIETNAAMLLAGGIAFGATRLFGGGVLKVVIALALAGVWVTPLVAALFPLEAATAMLGGLPDSWVQRLHIWSRAGAEIAAHPFGGGVEYARAISRPIVPVEINGVALNTMPLHPHNLFLHIWMDLGVVGALAMSALLLCVWVACTRMALSRSDAALFAALVAALFATAMTEWSVWQVWRFAAVWIAIIAARLATSPRSAPSAF